MRVEAARVGARVVDSLPFSMGGTAAQAQALADEGVDAVVGYLGAISPERVGFVLAAGMAFWAVTFGGHYDGAAAVAQLRALGAPAGMTVFLDVEGLTAFHADPQALIAQINAWADAVSAAGYVAGLYVGVPQPLTSDELYHLRVQRYWRGQGSVRDRFGALAEPTGCGWCVTQAWPSQTCGGVLVDFNLVGADYKSRTPTWTVAA